MKLSRNEKILISILIIVALLAIGYYILLEPQIDRYQNLLKEKEAKQAEYNMGLMEISLLDKLTSRSNELYDSINNKTIRYFPSIIQEKLMLMVNQIYSDTDVDVQDESYGFDYKYAPPYKLSNSPPSDSKKAPDLMELNENLSNLKSGQEPEETPSNNDALSEDQILAANAAVGSIKTMSLDAVMFGNFDQTMDLMGEIESLNRSIVVESISIKQLENTTQLVNINGEEIEVDIPEDALECSVNLLFNAIPKLVTQDEEYEAWELTGPYGKEDPFAAADTDS